MLGSALLLALVHAWPARADVAPLPFVPTGASGPAAVLELIALAGAFYCAARVFAGPKREDDAGRPVWCVWLGICLILAGAAGSVDEQAGREQRTRRRARLLQKVPVRPPTATR